MDDDVSLLSDRMDSLFFFSNVLSVSPTTTHKPASKKLLEEAIDCDNDNLDKPGKTRETTTESFATGNDVSSPVKERKKESRETKTTTTRRGFCKYANSKDPGRRRGIVKVLGSLELCWYDEVCEECERMWSLYDCYLNNPPSRDDMAMKDHIMSWVYSVAYVVRNSNSTKIT